MTYSGLKFCKYKHDIVVSHNLLLGCSLHETRRLLACSVGPLVIMIVLLDHRVLVDVWKGIQT